MQLDRRKFIVTSAAVSVANAATRVIADDKADGWIDAHVHVWTPDTKKYPLNKNYKIANMQPPSFTPGELFAHSKPSGVTRIVLIQMSFYRYDNSYMLQAIKDHPGVFSGVGIVDHHQVDVAAKMKQLAEGGVRGFRIHARGDDAANWVNDAGMAKVWKTAAEHGLAVCPLINPDDLQHIDRMCTRFPDTKVVVDHFARTGVSGKIDPKHVDALSRLGRFPKAHVKTSAFYALGKKAIPYDDLKPMIRRMLDAFGASRLMWASDCPYQVQGDHNYEASIALIRDRCEFLSESDKNFILRDTAKRLFFS